MYIILTLKAQPLPSAAETPSIANTMLIGMVASAIDLEIQEISRKTHTSRRWRAHQQVYKSASIEGKHEKRSALSLILVTL